MTWLDSHITRTVDHFIYLRKIDRAYAIHALQEYKKLGLIEPEELDKLIAERWKNERETKPN